MTLAASATSEITTRLRRRRRAARRRDGRRHAPRRPALGVGRIPSRCSQEHSERTLVASRTPATAAAWPTGDPTRPPRSWSN